MGDHSRPERPEEKIETLRKMAADESFRLSINERAAIAYALRKITRKTQG